MKVLGAILSGGRSSRFGSDKALAFLDGRRLIEHVIAALAPQVDAVVACGRAFEGLMELPDRPVGGLGPLGGLNAALHEAEKQGFASVLSVPCDVPDLPVDLHEQLAKCPVAYALDLPVIGLWPVRLAASLDEFLADDPRRSMRGWAHRVDATPVRLNRRLANINTVADLERLSARGA